MGRTRTWITAALVLGMVAGCAAGGAAPYRGADQGIDKAAYTLVNLHPDERRGTLTAVNYQQVGLIPRCTRVTFVGETRKGVQFTVDETGRTYTYLRHRSLREPFNQHLDLYFGDTCRPEDVARLSSVDQKGVREGKVYTGMSKQGVIYAIGYPPSHVTPSTDADQWRYWRNRWRTFIVHFDKGQVTRVQY